MDWTERSEIQVTMEQAIEASRWLSDRIREGLGERSDLDRKGLFAMAQFSLSLDHREAILALVSLNANPSAMALARPTVEAFIRGLWAEAIASEKQLAEFFQERYDPKLDSVAKVLKGIEHPMSELMGPLQRAFKALHDYTHGGPRQLSRWLHKGVVEPRYAPKQIVELLRLVDIVGSLAAAGRESISGRSSDSMLGLAREVLHRQYYGRHAAL